MSRAEQVDLAKAFSKPEPRVTPDSEIVVTKEQLKLILMATIQWLSDRNLDDEDKDIINTAIDKVFTAKPSPDVATKEYARQVGTCTHGWSR